MDGVYLYRNGQQFARMGRCLLLSVYVRNTVAPNTSSIAEVDIASKSANTQTIMDFSTLLRLSKLGNAETTTIIKEIKDKKVHVVEMKGSDGVSIIVLVVAGGEELPGCGTLERKQRYI
jgi:hypothetical protein